MTDPMFLNASGLRDLSQRLNSIRAHENVEHEMTIVRASIELDEAARRLDALAAERDRADRAEARLAQILEYADSTYTASTVARRIVQMGKATA